MHRRWEAFARGPRPKLPPPSARPNADWDCPPADWACAGIPTRRPAPGVRVAAVEPGQRGGPGRTVGRRPHRAVRGRRYRFARRLSLDRAGSSQSGDGASGPRQACRASRFDAVAGRQSDAAGDQLARDDAEPGVVILTRVLPGSAAEAAGLHVNDRIYRLAGRDFATADEFHNLIKTLSAAVGARRRIARPDGKVRLTCRPNRHRPRPKRSTREVRTSPRRTR